MAVVSSCGRTTRGRSSPLSAHLQAGKGRSLTLEHAHRTAAAMAQICLKQGNQGARSPKEAQEFQDQKEPGLEQSQLEPRHNFSPNDWVAPQLGLPEQSSTGRKVKLNKQGACTNKPLERNSSRAILSI